jgi:carbonic anhydrase
MNADQVLTRLKEGNQRYIADKLNRDLQDTNRRGELASGQAPYAIILSCADSRVVPEMVFDTGLGEVFVVRVAGNIANTDSVASIEYAVANLGSSLIVVLGHQSCGAVTAAIQGGDLGNNLNHLLGQIKPAVDSCESSDVDTVVKHNANYVAEQLVSTSDIIANAVKDGGVKIVSGFYELGTGKVEFL